MPCGRLARWALLIQQYDFEIIHRAAVSNGNADALSRRSYDPILAAIDSSGITSRIVLATKKILFIKLR